jgi:hypothetical protein
VPVVQPSAHFTYGYDTSATTYDGANEALDISGVLDTLKATDVPLLTLIGRDSLRDPAVQVKHEWLEDEIRGLSATTTDADLNNTTDNGSAVTLTLGTAGDYLKFRGAAVGTGPCDIVRIFSTAGMEIAPVTATANNSIDVIRGYFDGSAPVDHTGYTKYIQIIGTFQPQGKTTVGAQRTTLKANKYNYTQIFEDAYAANATQQVTKKWLRQDEKSYQFGLIAENMGIGFERTLLYGERIAPAAANGGTMQGIVGTMSTNVYDKAQAILQESHLRDAIQAMWENGAGGDEGIYAFVNGPQHIRLGQLLDPYRQAGYSDRALGTWIDRFRSPFGSMTVVLDRHVDKGDVILVDSSRVGFGPLVGRALGMSKIASTSRESETWQWTGEYTCEVRQEKAHAYITDLAQSGF